MHANRIAPRRRGHIAPLLTGLQNSPWWTSLHPEVVVTRKHLLSAVVVLALVTESVLLALLAERHRTLRSDMLRVRRDALVPRAGTFYPSFDAVDVAANHHWRVGAPDSGRA
jgi:hypothetical protein